MTRRVLHKFLGLLASIGGVVGALGAGEAARADQNDPRLDSLFLSLAHASDEAQSRDLLGQINRIWLVHPDDTVTEMMALGRQLMARGALAQATEVFGDVVARAPDYSEGWNLLATALFYQRRYAQALEPTRKTLSLEPRHYGAMWGIGMIYRALGQPDQTRRYLQLTYALAPNLPDPLAMAEQLGEGF